MIHKVALFVLAVLNLILTAVAIYKGKQNLSMALGLLEIVIVFLWWSS